MERVIDAELSLPACQKADSSAMWMLESLLDVPGKAEESLFFEDGCPTSQLMLLPHQRAQASLSTRAGGFGLSSAEERRMSGSVGSIVATVPKVLADLSGIVGEKIRRGLPNSYLVRRIGGAPGTSATCTGFRRKPWRTSCRKDGGTEPCDQESSTHQGSRLLKCCQHMTPKRQAPAKPNTDWGNW